MTYDDAPVAVTGGKRLGITWASWMGDWFVSYSPRNDNENAEGQWDQWVSMAIKILQHDATKLTRPEAAAAVASLDSKDYYSETDVSLTDEQAKNLFGAS
jgi:hypothetical protein